MKTVATALLTGAADNGGYIPSRSNTRGRWPTACHQYFGIRTDLDATKADASAAESTQGEN